MEKLTPGIFAPAPQRASFGQMAAAQGKIEAKLMCGAPQPEEAGGFSLGPQPLVMDVTSAAAAFDAVLTR